MDLLHAFVEEFAATFAPPEPYRGKHGNTWLISRAWSDHMRKWLRARYDVTFEHPMSGRRRLDAALRARSVVVGAPKMDVALEWEWDNNKVERDFPEGDFAKLFEVDARCGIAIVQTRVDGGRGTAQAQRTLQRLAESYRRRKYVDRPIGILEVRRLQHHGDHVEFDCRYLAPSEEMGRTVATWRYRES